MRKNFFFQPKILLIIIFGLLSVISSMLLNSWMPLFFLLGFLILIQATAISFEAILSAIKHPESQTKYIELHAAIATMAASFFIMILIGLVERLVWLHAPNIPAAIVKYDFADKEFTEKDFSAFKMDCKDRGTIVIRDAPDNLVNVRCGEFFPDRITLRANRASFEFEFARHLRASN